MYKNEGTHNVGVYVKTSLTYVTYHYFPNKFDQTSNQTKKKK